MFANDRIIGSAEACALLGISRKTLTRWVAAGKLEAANKLPGLNGAYLFKYAVVAAKAAELTKGAGLCNCR